MAFTSYPQNGPQVRGLAFGLMMGIAALQPALAQEVPEPGTPEWKSQYAVDLAAARLQPIPVEKPAGATSYSITYKGELAGFDVGRIFLNSSVSPDGYAVDYRMEQKGIARWFSDAEARAEARGTVENGEIASHYYLNHDYESDDDQQYVELYRQNGNSRLRLWTAPQYSFHQSVPENVAMGAVDPMGALMALGFFDRPVGSTSPCDRTVKVFDGRRRFDLVMTDEGDQWIRKGGKGRFEGMARKCRLEQLKVAGYREKDRGDIDGDLFVFLAPVPEDFRTPTFAYIPVMIIAKQGLFSARLEGKNPLITAPDGRQINLGNLPRQKRPRR